MKAITVRQPWAWAIMHAGKDVENRSRNVAGSYRGPLVIHAAKRIEEDEFVDALRFFDGMGFERPQGKVGDLGFGVALGIVELVDVHWVASCIRYSSNELVDDFRLCSHWAQPDCWHLVLRNPRWFPEPIPYRGHLGLWEFPDDLLPEEYR